MTPPAAALIGAGWHGRSHLRNLARLQRRGRLRLAAVCDTRPLDPAARALLPSGVPSFTDHRAMLAAARPDVAVIVTPPNTHLALATDALLAGCDLLLEKPPVTRLADHDRLAALLEQSGRACQVGFQALGSPALAELEQAVAAGRLGAVTGIGVAGAWLRDDAYYQRGSWAGRRFLDGEPTADGALTNPFAHGLMNALVLARAAAGGADPDPVALELELYRVRDIEVDDTACLRALLPGGLRLAVAVTLCAARPRPPRLVVRGSAGTATLYYTEDRLQLPGDPEPRRVPGRVDLLENLLDHRADPARAPLLAPLARTRPFTRIVEAVHASPPPHRIGQRFLDIRGQGGERQVTVRGVDEAVEASADRLALFSELGVAWARAPHTWKLTGDRLVAVPAKEEPCGS